MRILVIVNPISGGGRAARAAARLRALLDGAGHSVELFETRRAGDAAGRAGSIDPDLERLLVVGGDGTLNEVLNGLRDPAAVPLAQLPTGTANILGHELGLSRRPERVARSLESGPVRLLDMGQADERRFLMVCSTGFDAMVTREIQQRRTGTLGYAGYIKPIVRVLRDYRPPRIEVTVDGHEAAGELVIVSNTRNYGGLFTIADRARCDSGHLDVCVLERASLPQLFRAGAGGLTGGLSGQRGVTYLTGREIALRASEPTPVEVDGDYYGMTPVTIGVVPSHVPFVVPPNAGEPA